jgi:hypothetical protein
MAKCKVVYPINPCMWMYLVYSHFESWDLRVFKVWGPKTFSKLGPFGHNLQNLVIRYQCNFFDMMCYGILEPWVHSLSPCTKTRCVCKSFTMGWRWVREVEFKVKSNCTNQEKWGYYILESNWWTNRSWAIHIHKIYHQMNLGKSRHFPPYNVTCRWR